MANIVGINRNVADVSDDARLLTEAVTRSSAEIANLGGRLFVINRTGIAPTGSGAFYFYFRNLETRDVVFTVWQGSSTADLSTRNFMKAVSGTAGFPAGSDAVITSRNLGSSAPLAAEARFDTTGVTGLADLGTVAFHRHVGFPANFDANPPQTADMTGGVVVPRGKAIAIQRGGGAGDMDLVLVIEVQK